MWLCHRERQPGHRHDGSAGNNETVLQTAVSLELWCHADLLEKPGCAAELEISLAGLGRASKYPDLSIYHTFCHTSGRLFYDRGLTDRECLKDRWLLPGLYAGGSGSGAAGLQLRKGKSETADLADPPTPDLALADLAGALQSRTPG